MYTPRDILSDVKAYCEQTNTVGSLANISAILMQAIPDLNWVGFYFDDGSKLRLGPFQGKPACTEIAYERGVCGAAFSNNTSMLVNDVHKFSDHIACDADSNAEIVVPLRQHNQVVGVLDIDSPKKNRFSQADLQLFEEVSVIMSENLNLSNYWFHRDV